MRFELECKIDDLADFIEGESMPEHCFVKGLTDEICRSCLAVVNTARVTKDIYNKEYKLLYEELPVDSGIRIRNFVKQNCFISTSGG